MSRMRTALVQVVPFLLPAMSRASTHAASGITLAELRVLQQLHDGKVASGAIARDDSVAYSGIQQRVDRLFNRGLIAAERPRWDRRRLVLTLTPAGDSTRAAGATSIRNTVAKMLDGSGLADLAAIQEGLDILERVLAPAADADAGDEP